MGQIVNNILNYLKLDTRDYDQNGKKITKNTQQNTKKMSKSFKDLSSTVKKETNAMTVALGTFAGNIATKAFNSITSGMIETTRSFENCTTSLTAWTGSIEKSKELFWSLNALEDETTISTDKLVQAFISLKKNGLDASNDSLKSYSAIAIGLGKDLSTVTDAIAKASQGQFKGLKELGIQAKQEGDSISLTYQGVTSKIKANTKDLQEYIQQLSSDQFSTALEARTQTIGGAIDRFKNAFGTLQTVLFNTDTATGQVFISIVEGATNCVNKLISIFNSPEFNKQLFNVVNDFKSYWDSFFESNEKDAKDTTDAFSLHWETVIGNVKIFLMSLFSQFQKFFTYVKSGFNTISDTIVGTYNDVSKQIKDKGILSALNPFNLGKTLGSNTSNSMLANAEELEKEISLIDDAIEQAFKDQVKENKELVKRLENEKELTQIKREQAQITSGNAIGGSSNSKAIAQVKDTIEQQKALAQKAIYDICATQEQKDKDAITAKITELQNYYDLALITEQEYQEARSKLITDYYSKQKKQDTKMGEDSYVTKMTDGLNDLSNAFGNLTQNMNENSNTYKALFAIEKGFAVASATANAIVAWTKALATATNWYEGLANYASAVALTTNIISQLSSITMHDKGGNIPAGQIGIVGEYGPEIVRGPANVTSRKDTAELLENAGSNVVVNLYEDNSKAGTVEQNQTDEGNIINIFVSNIRKGGQMASVLQQSYGLKRVGY